MMSWRKFRNLIERQMATGKDEEQDSDYYSSGKGTDTNYLSANNLIDSWLSSNVDVYVSPEVTLQSSHTNDEVEITGTLIYAAFERARQQIVQALTTDDLNILFVNFSEPGLDEIVVTVVIKEQQFTCMFLSHEEANMIDEDVDYVDLGWASLYFTNDNFGSVIYVDNDFNQ